MEECMQRFEECCEKRECCTKVSTQYADVSLPIKLKPYAAVGEIETTCCCAPLVTLRQNPGAKCPCCCELIITQTLCVKIPVEYGTDVEVGEKAMNCRPPQCNNQS